MALIAFKSVLRAPLGAFTFVISAATEFLSHYYQYQFYQMVRETDNSQERSMPMGFLLLPPLALYRCCGHVREAQSNLANLTLCRYG